MSHGRFNLGPGVREGQADRHDDGRVWGNISSALNNYLVTRRSSLSAKDSGRWIHRPKIHINHMQQPPPTTTAHQLHTQPNVEELRNALCAGARRLRLGL